LHAAAKSLGALAAPSETARPEAARIAKNARSAPIGNGGRKASGRAEALTPHLQLEN
jgi:hypothetical protein